MTKKKRTSVNYICSVCSESHEAYVPEVGVVLRLPITRELLLLIERACWIELLNDFSAVVAASRFPKNVLYGCIEWSEVMTLIYFD